jgi:hypothetical protein
VVEPGPALGPFTVRPAHAHIGEALILTGRTRGRVPYLPPVLMLYSARQRVVSLAPACSGSMALPVLSAQLMPTPLSRTYPSRGFGVPNDVPIGTVWRVRVRVPARMDTLEDFADGVPRPGPTVAGRYYIAASSTYMEGPCDPPPGAKSDDIYEVSAVDIVGR